MISERTKKVFLGLVIIVLSIAVFLVIKATLSVAANSGDTTEIIGEYTYTHSDGSAEVQAFHYWHGSKDHGIAVVSGKELYCVEPGTYLSYQYLEDCISLETALQYGDLYGTPKTWPTVTGHRTFTDEGEYTAPYLWCTGNHIVCDQNYPDAAYILSMSSSYSDDKQTAIWNTDLSSGTPYATESLTYEAVAYEEFYEETSSAEGASARNTKIAAEDLTDIDEIDVNVDYTEQTLVIGPFSIDYIYGVYEDVGVAFGGISDMYLIGYNSSGEVVQERIEIEKYIYDDVEYDLEFFEPDDTYVDYSEQSYPKGVSAGEEEFYVKISNPNANATGDADSVRYYKLHVEFKWMSAYATVCKMTSICYKVSWTCSETTTSTTTTTTDEDGNETTTTTYTTKCTATSWLEQCESQDHINVLESGRILYTVSIETGYAEEPDEDNNTPNITINTPDDNNTTITNEPDGGDDGSNDGDDDELIDSAMELGGIVWVDGVTTKESEADGVSNTGGDVDMGLPNVKVTLYDEDGNIVELLVDEDSATGDEIYHCINPTYTDENGEYLFRGLDPSKKYYVVFEYNGLQYLPTEYLNTADGQYTSVDLMVDAGLYNTDEWEVTSKGTEASEGTSVTGVEITRDEFDERFSEITAYPENYPSSNSLGVVGEYNATFTQRDLMGYTLDEDGYYQKTGTQLVDGYEYDENGNETTTYTQGLISEKVREYIEANKEFPDDNAMLEIYTEIANSTADSEETWRMLQFIEDTKIQAYSGSAFTEEIDYYPVYDQFHVEDDESIHSVAGVDYYPIYPGQYYINLGLWRRQEYDAALREDVFKAAIKINGKTLTYDYDKRTEEDEDGTNNGDGQDNNTYWDINVRMNDYDNYYGIGYNRDLYESDYDYESSDEHPRR